MPWFEAVRLALKTIRAQKLKSFFSLVGVLIGTTFLVAVVSIVQGMNVYMEDRFANKLVGLNTFQLRRMPNFNMGNINCPFQRRKVFRAIAQQRDLVVGDEFRHSRVITAERAAWSETLANAVPPCTCACWM